MTSIRFQLRFSQGACLLALCILLATAPPAPAQSQAVEVALGSSGESVTLMPVESGGYTLDGAPVVSGETMTTSANGSSYTLSMGEDGTWAATYNPVEVTVPLGTRGELVIITRQEDGSYALPDGTTITAETRYTTESGNTYGVALGEDGVPMAVFVPEAVMAALGELGGTLTLYRQEDDSFQDADGMTVMAGTIVTANGNEYVLERTESGGWMGTYRPEMQTLDLGAEGGSATVTRFEDGSWQLGERTVASGGTVAAENEAGDTNTYMLTLTAGVWTARYAPEALEVAGTDFQVTRDEDSGGYSVAGAAGVTLPADGSGNIDLYGALYRVSMDAEGMFSGMRYDLPMVEGTAMKADAAGVSDLPMLSTNDRNTPVDETGVTLEVVEAEFAMGDLLGTGQATAAGPRLAANTLTELTKVRGQMERLIETQRAGTFGDDQATFRSLLDRHWTRAEGHLRSFFGEDDLELEREYNRDRVLDAVDRIVEAFSSAESLAAATEARGSGFISGFKTLSAANAAKAFEAEEWTGEAVLGVLGAVRYGAASYVERADATKDLSSGRRAQGFAWSTVEPVRRASHVQTQGNAYYTGGTYATDSKGVLYAGDMDLQVRFGPSRVDALVQNLARTDTGAAWTYGFGGAVQAITLPEANLRRNGSWGETGGEVRLSYEFGAGSIADVEEGVEGDFSGRLLGREPDAGLQVLGAWRIADSRGTLLAGGYGATLAPDPGDRRAARELFLFRQALAEAGLGEGSEVDPADAEAVEAVVDQFQAALVVAGYSPPAARTVALSFRREVLAGTPEQDPLQTATKTFTTAQTRGMLGDPYEEDQFRLALTAAGLGEQTALDPADGPAVEAAVNQFQAALRRAGYTTAAARAAVMAFQTTVEAGSASQSPLEVAAAVFGAAREDGTLESTTAVPEADLATAASFSTRAVLTRNAGNGGLRPASDLEPLVLPRGEPGVAITAPRTTISADNNNIVVADYFRGGNFRYRDEDDTRWIGDDRSYEFYDYKDEPRNFYKFTLDRERLFTDGYVPVSRDSRATISAEAEIKSPTHVQIVREELTKLLGQLRRVVDLGGADASDSDIRFANDQRQRIFDEMQNWIRDHLLGPDNSGRDLITRGTDATRDSGVLDPAETEPLTGNAANAWTAHSDYPVNGQGVAQDGEVLSRVEDVLAALQDRDAFADAFAEGGIFHGKAVGGFEHDPRAVNPPSVDAMWNKSPTRIMLVTDTTDYTRMGAWQINDSAYAAQHLSWWRDGSYSGYYRITEFGEPFAYSPLAQSDYDSISASRYPAGVLATYEGRTVAMQHTVFYEGDVTAKVQWDAATVAGQLRVDLNDLTAREGGGLGLLQHGLRNYWDAGNRTFTRSRPGTYDVETLTFWADIGADANGKIGFEETDIDVAITYGDLPGELKGYREDTLWNVNTLEISGGRLRVHHSGSNRPSDGRATNPGDGIPNPATITHFDLFDTSSPPAAGTSVSMGAAALAELNNLATADWTDSNGRLAHKLELVSATYHRPASGNGRVVLEFEDGTTLENAIGGYTAGTIFATDPDGGGPRNQKSHVTWSEPGVPEPGFDNFFSGPGKGYLNVAESRVNLSAEISGMFVGQGPDGPLGVMGTYAIIGKGSQYGTGHWISSTAGDGGAGKIYGSFGADFNPAP